MTYNRSSLWRRHGSINLTVLQTCEKDRKWQKKAGKKKERDAQRALADSSTTLTSHCFSFAGPSTSLASHTLSLKKEKQTWKAVRREARLRSDQRSAVGVSQHTGTGSTGSGSLLLGHYVIRWAQFALLLACAGLWGSLVCECVLGQREVKEARAVHSSRTPPPSFSCTPLYINPKVFRLPLFRDIFNSLIQLSSQLLLLPSLCASLPDCTL